MSGIPEVLVPVSFSVTRECRDIIWCLKPLFIWMRIFGIELDPRLQNKVLLLYGFLILLAVIYSNIDITASVFRELSFQTIPNETVTTVTATWNVRIDCVNQCFLVAGVYPTLFYISRYQLPHILGVIAKFESSRCKLNHVQLRKRFFLGFVPLLAVENE